jgi:hypothetical protein
MNVSAFNELDSDDTVLAALLDPSVFAPEALVAEPMG